MSTRAIASGLAISKNTVTADQQVSLAGTPNRTTPSSTQVQGTERAHGDEVSETGAHPTQAELSHAVGTMTSWHETWQAVKSAADTTALGTPKDIRLMPLEA